MIASRLAPTLRIYWFSALATLAIWAGVSATSGAIGFIAVVTLTGLEVSLSIDNAVVNAELVGRLSPFWRRLFMTVGILVAVFLVRFVLPVVIVQLTSGLGFFQVIELAWNDPETYGRELESAAPMIDSFGGTFLTMIGLGFFLDAEKETHWIGWLERRLARVGRFDNVSIFVMLVVPLALAATAPGPRLPIVVASVSGVLLHVGLDMFGKAMEPSEGDQQPGSLLTGGVTGVVGTAAAVVFARLEVLDASFSFDGVIGAFAVTSSVLIMMAGLGAGALWVRSITVHLVEAGTLAKYRFLKHGAHLAITILGVVMLAKVYHLHSPEWLIGSIGLVAIGAAVVSSVVAQRRELRALLGGSERDLISA